MESKTLCGQLLKLKHVLFISTGIFLLVCSYFYTRLNLTEDAFIMFRYAKNLANGHGLVWNIGKDPVEGTTAFLWTILLSICYKFRLTFEASVPLLNGLFLTLTIILIYFTAVFLFKVDAIAGFIAICILATSPLVFQMSAGFETPMFSFLMMTFTVCCTALIFCLDQVKYWAQFRTFTYCLYGRDTNCFTVGCKFFAGVGTTMGKGKTYLHKD